MNRLRELRRAKLLTQKELAERVGVWYQTVQGWENGERQPRPAAMRKLCEVLEIAPAELLAALAADAEDADREVGKAAA